MFEKPAVRMDVAELPPGPELAAALGGVPPSAMTGRELLDAVTGWERLTAWAQAGQLEAVAELARRRPAPGGEPSDVPARGDRVSEFAADEIAAALRLSRRAAELRLSLALELHERLPGTAALLGAGAIDLPRARAVADAVVVLGDPDAVTDVEARVLPRAPEQTVGALRAALARAVVAADPLAAERRHAEGVAERGVRHQPGCTDGIGGLDVTGPVDDIDAIHTALTALAVRAGSPDDARTLDARRFDALVDLARGALDDPGLPHPTRARTRVQLVVPALTLLGHAETPGELSGCGPVPASMARRLAADADWQRLLVDPVDGRLLEVDQHTYRPAAAVTDHVLTRDRTCRFTGCRQPAWRCDLDHTVPHPDGETCPGNLGPLCRHHHRLKHETDWTLTQPTPGRFVWTDPTGHTYSVTADPPADPVHPRWTRPDWWTRDCSTGSSRPSDDDVGVEPPGPDPEFDDSHLPESPVPFAPDDPDQLRADQHAGIRLGDLDLGDPALDIDNAGDPHPTGRRWITEPPHPDEPPDPDDVRELVARARVASTTASTLPDRARRSIATVGSAGARAEDPHPLEIRGCGS